MEKKWEGNEKKKEKRMKKDWKRKGFKVKEGRMKKNGKEDNS